MSGRLFSLLAYIRYWLLKEDHYSQQSPFVFELYQSLLNHLKTKENGDPTIETFRGQLLAEQRKIQVDDFGAGSKRVPERERKIRNITRYSTSSAKYAQLYQYFCKQTPADQVIELGTCMGISTRYLAKATSGKLYTFEGASEIWKVAQAAPKPEKTEFVLGPIDQTLPVLLQQIPQVDFALIDATHTYSATLAYFHLLKTKALPTSIFAIGDIHWSQEMAKAWKEIQTLPEIKLTLDFYECGIVFFDFSGEKKHLILDC